MTEKRVVIMWHQSEWPSCAVLNLQTRTHLLYVQTDNETNGLINVFNHNIEKLHLDEFISWNDG